MAPHHGMPRRAPAGAQLPRGAGRVARSGEVIGGLFFGHPSRACSPSARSAWSTASPPRPRSRSTTRGCTSGRTTPPRSASSLLEAERAARAEAERVSRMKDEFLATLSHELRTPLNADPRLGRRCCRARQARAGRRSTQGLEAIERNARAQTQLIEDLLDMSRIISGKLRLDVQRVDLGRRHRGRARDRRARPPTPRASASRDDRSTRWPARSPATRDRLQQVVWNLLSNAVKFTPEGGQRAGAARARRTRTSRSASPTPASASSPSSCRTSSTASARPTRRRPARTAAWGWACRSSSTWSSCTAARVAAKSRRRGPGRDVRASRLPLRGRAATSRRRAARVRPTRAGRRPTPSRRSPLDGRQRAGRRRRARRPRAGPPRPRRARRRAWSPPARPPRRSPLLDAQPARRARQRHRHARARTATSSSARCARRASRRRRHARPSR